MLVLEEQKEESVKKQKKTNPGNKSAKQHPFLIHSFIVKSTVLYEEGSIQDAVVDSLPSSNHKPTLNSASRQNKQGSCSMSRDSLALSMKHTSSSSFFRVKRDSASSWPNKEREKKGAFEQKG